MRGHIVKRYENSHIIVVELGQYPATCKRKQQWISVKETMKEAEKQLADIFHQLNTRAFVAPEKESVISYFTRWLQDYRPNLSPRGYEHYEGIIRNNIEACIEALPSQQEHVVHRLPYSWLAAGLWGWNE
jgi:hypothetical protein